MTSRCRDRICTFGLNIHEGAATTNGFKRVHNSGIDGASHDMKRERDHAFKVQKESIHSVDWTLLEVAKTFRDLIACVDGCCVLNNECAHFIIYFGWGEVFG